MPFPHYRPVNHEFNDPTRKLVTCNIIICMLKWKLLPCNALEHAHWKQIWESQGLTQIWKTGLKELTQNTFQNVVQIINEATHCSTSVAFVAGPALRTRLVSILSFIIVAGPAHGERALIAGHEKLPFRGHTDVVTANLTNVAVDVVQRLRLHMTNTETPGLQQLALNLRQ